MVDSLTLGLSGSEWSYLPALARLALALGLGLFIGMERERRGKEAGLRTFSLVCLLGALGGILGELYAVSALGLLGVLIVLLSVLSIQSGQSIELTTSAAMAVTGFIGVSCGMGHTLTPVAVAIVVAGLLAWKEPMVLFTLGLSEEETRSAILLGILTFVIDPALPKGTIDPWGLIDLRAAWLTVILIAAIAFTNYVLLKKYGSRGIALSGFLGGFVNTKVTTTELTRRVRESGGDMRELAYRGLVLARASMVLRNSFVLAILSVSTFAVALPALIMMLLAAGWFGVRRQLGPEAKGAPEHGTLSFASPFKLFTVLRFGALFLVLQVLGTLGQRLAGASGVYLVTAIGSVASSASAISSVAILQSRGTIAALPAAVAVIVACIISTCIDAVLVNRISGDDQLSQRMVRATIVICSAGALGIGVVLGLALMGG